MKVDILTTEIETKAPYWLSPLAKQADLMAEIRDKHRRQAREEQQIRDFDESKHPRDEHGRWTDGGDGSDIPASDTATDMSKAEIEAARFALSADFPNLSLDEIKIDGDRNPEFNCIGWALGDNHRPWWPQSMYFWPNDKDTTSIKTFDKLLTKTAHAQKTEDQKPEKGFVKLALFAEDLLKPTHLARQLPNGEWSSKFGAWFLARHGTDVHHLDGGFYGDLVSIYKVPESDWKKLKDLENNA